MAVTAVVGIKAISSSFPIRLYPEPLLATAAPSLTASFASCFAFTAASLASAYCCHHLVHSYSYLPSVITFAPFVTYTPFTADSVMAIAFQAWVVVVDPLLEEYLPFERAGFAQ